MQQSDFAPRPSLDDRYNRALLQSAHPANWRNPAPARQYNLVIVGAGPAGVFAARAAAAAGAKVALVERALLGGDCRNFGTIPSKSLISASRLYAHMRDAEDYGAQAPSDIDINFARVMERMRRIRARINSYDSVERLTAAGIDMFFGEGRFTGPRSLWVDGAILHFKKALIATGSRPTRPLISGAEETGYLTNENVFDLKACPPRLMVIGGGPLGCEGAQAMARLGAHVIIAQNDPLFLPGEERDAAQILSDAMASDGVEINLNTEVVGMRREGGQKLVDLVSDDNMRTVVVDEILVGIGRAPNVEGMDLERAGVSFDLHSGIIVNDFLQTTNPRIYAAGDVCLKYKFTHAAWASAEIVVQNALFLGRKRLSALKIPWCTYTDPEIAHVGLYVREARESAIPVRTFTIMMHDVDRAITDGEEKGFVKLHVSQRSDQILGATVVARHAGEMINGISLAITSGIGLRALAQVIHTYPTQAAAIKQAADAYSRTRTTPFRRALASRWLAW